MIPKIIHYVWIGDKSSIPEIEQSWIQENKILNPSYTFKIWNEDDVPNCLFLQNCISQKLHSYASDYIRSYALYSEGGFYFDTDFKLIKPIPESWLKYETVIPKETDWFVSNYLWGSTKGCKFSEEMLNKYNNYSCEQNPLDVDYWVAPKLMENIVKKTFGEQNICNKYNKSWIGNDRCLILPTKISCPYYPWDKDRINDRVDISIAVGIHYWNGYNARYNLDRFSYSSGCFI